MINTINPLTMTSFRKTKTLPTPEWLTKEQEEPTTIPGGGGGGGLDLPPGGSTTESNRGEEILTDAEVRGVTAGRRAGAKRQL